MPADDATTSHLDQIFAQWDTADTPGVAVGVVRNGDPVYVRCFGLASVEHCVPITASTVFDIASMTKQFTAIAVLMLARDGKLDLNDDVSNYLPELPRSTPPVRIHHCLYHTCGLTDWISALELAGPASDFCSIDRAFRTIIALSRTMFPAGHAHSYSNTGYVLLAWIVERVSGESLPQYLKAQVFEPLSMTGAGFRADAGEILPELAQGYYIDEDRSLYRGTSQFEVHGDGGMLASIADMIAWLRNLSSRNLGDAGLYDMMFAPGRLDDGTTLRYVAGWEVDRYHGSRVLRHGGMGQGYQSHIAWVPEHEIGIAILGNVRPCWPWPAANRILDLLLADKAKRPVTGTGIAEAAGESGFAGRYFTDTGLPVLVEWRGDRLFIDIWLWSMPFMRVSDDTFEDEDAGDTVSFHRDGAGEVTHFTLKTKDDACPRMHSPIRRAVRYEDVMIDFALLPTFEGRYLSDELETIYTISAQDQGLIARHLRCHHWHLRPIRSRLSGGFANDFAQTGNWPGMVTFELGDDGRISGFTVRGTRFNLFFRRL